MHVWLGYLSFSKYIICEIFALPFRGDPTDKIAVLRYVSCSSTINLKCLSLDKIWKQLAKTSNIKSISSRHSEGICWIWNMTEVCVSQQTTAYQRNKGLWMQSGSCSTRIWHTPSIASATCHVKQMGQNGGNSTLLVSDLVMWEGGKNRKRRQTEQKYRPFGAGSSRLLV